MTALDAAIAHEVADKRIPSISYALFDAIGVIRKAHLTRADLPPLRHDTLFRLASISKTFAALAAMREVEAGRLDLDADVSRYVGPFQPTWQGEPSTVTLRGLLSHRSGLTREAGVGHYLANDNAPLAASVDSVRTSRLKVAPDGQTYRYSNAGFAVIGAAVEASCGDRYGEYLQAAILAPLGMSDTARAIGPENVARLAPAILWDEEGDRPAPVFNLGCAPAGSIVSTLDDMAVYGQALLAPNNPVVSRAKLEAMWKPAGGSSPGYGLGFTVDTLDGHRMVGHGGAIYGYATQLLLLPDAGLGIFMVACADAMGEHVTRLSRYGLQLELAAQGRADVPPPPAGLPGRDAATARKLIALYGTDEGAAAGHPFSPHLGCYAPDFMPTHLMQSCGRLICVIEGLFPHECAPLGGNRYRMGKGMYEDEILELGVTSPAGHPAIRVGEMVLERLA